MGAEELGRVVSVNVSLGRAHEWHGREVVSGIWKEPVAGRVAAGVEGLAGDQQADRRVHGGPDMAVYAYAQEDYDWWSERLGRTPDPGLFGENLTVEGIDVNGAVIGTRWQVNEVLLEVSQPRMPCFKLGMRMGDAGFVDQFRDAGRFGAYLRVLEPGTIGAGDPVEVGAPGAGGVTIAELGRAHSDPTPEFLDRVLADPAVPLAWSDWAAKGRAKQRR